MDTVEPIRILRPGTFTDVNGKTVTFTKADLQRVVESYDAAEHPAPIVVGHPKIDHPAYGWVKSLSVRDGEVVAEPDQVEPAFAELVNAGRYKKISASFYPPDSHANPVPGSLYLKHVGFLGAAAPAIKGLGTVSFAAADDDAFVIELAAPDPDPERDPNPKPENDMPETVNLAEHNRVQSELEKAQAENARLKKEAADRETAAFHDANVAFAESQIKAGKLAPRAREQVIGLMDTLAGDQVIAFGEGEGRKELAPIDAFKGLFDDAQPIISFGEFAGADKDAPTDRSAADLAQEAVEFAEAERQAGRTITVAEAVRRVARKAAD